MQFKPITCAAKILLMISLLIVCGRSLVSAQSPLSYVINTVTNRTLTQGMEKIYLHTDKPYYAPGDTLWFKVYLFNAAYLNYSEKSGIVYIEIANDQNKVVKRAMVSMTIGLGFGDIPLKEKEFSQGIYIIRAYTNWMRNFDEHYLFTKQFYINSPGDQDVLINSRFDMKTDATGKQNAAISLQLNKIDRQPLVLTDFQLKVNEGKKTWFKDKLATKLDGTMDFNFEIPPKADPGKMNISLQVIRKNQEGATLMVPIVLNRPENIDLQFMPEGGSMITGLDTRVAFKALNEDGKGADVSGAIFDSKQLEVATFKSDHKGIGVFTFHPLPGEIYTAKIRSANGYYGKTYALPLAKPSGIVLNIVNNLKNDSLTVNVIASPDQVAAVHSCYLVAQSRGVICYGAMFQVDKSNKKIRVSKTVFPTGVARFTLLNQSRQPLNERIVYVDQGDAFRIGISPDKKQYGKRDSATLDLLVTDKSGKPVQGSFSIAVTDDAQVRNDSLEYNSLKTTLLLTSDLKGSIEDPGYYNSAASSNLKWKQLDNLLLAQGWVNYDWVAAFQPEKAPLYQPESKFSVSGKVTNIFNKPVEKSGVILMSKKPMMFRDTVTGKDGIFNFDQIYPSDTAIYFLQARNKKGKEFNVGIDVFEFKPPVFTAPAGLTIPWYVNIDSSRIRILNNFVANKLELDKLHGGSLLREVKITGMKVVKDSKNLNGAGESDFALSQEDLQNAGKVTLGELLSKNVKGFKLGFGKHPYHYFISDQVFHLIIDGIDIDFSWPGGTAIEYRDYVNSFLDYYTAEDIKGIEIMRSSKYLGRYAQSFLDPMAVPWDHAFAEVTTYSGSGPFLHNTPGTYLYKPVAFTQQKHFYSPKYTAKVDNSFIDARTTVYWNPNIVTDQSGKVRVIFYTTDKPGTYSITIEGSDMNGGIGSFLGRITVK